MSNLTDYSNNISPSLMDIRTEYLEPITSNTLKYTFRLDQSGYLDSNSMLVFKLQAVGAAQNNLCRVNMFNGALGGIKRCIFQVGDHILNDVQELYKYSTLKNLGSINPSIKNNHVAHYLGNQMRMTTLQNTNADYLSGVSYTTVIPSGVGSIEVDRSASGINLGAFADGAGAQVNSYRIGTDKNGNAMYGIRLGMLIPALQGQKIPLFLFQSQRILITVEFNTADLWIHNLKAANLNYGGVAMPYCAAGEVIPTDVRLVVDYIIMPSEVQEEVKAQTAKDGGYTLEFYDIVNVEKSIPANTSNNSVEDLEHRIGQNGREVHNIFMLKEAATQTDLNLAGNSAPRCVFNRQQILGVEKEEFNVNIDGTDEFPNFVYSPIAQYNEVKEALGADLRIERPIYCNDPNTVQARLSSANGGLVGMYKPLACSLRNGNVAVVGGGRQIGNYPIIWKYRREVFVAASGQARATSIGMNVSYMIEVSRVANIKQIGSGMLVNVSY